MVLDAQGGYWFPSTGYGKPEDLLEICWDDIIKIPGYDKLVPGTFDLVITFDDLKSSNIRYHWLSERRPFLPLSVEEGTITVDGKCSK